jgi:putative Mg2+ transporter-C (MgtC) family protein
MNPLQFTIRLCCALILGALIGLERQWRQRITGLRTNGLVAVGSAMFVMMGSMLPGGDSMGRVASYVVSGIGFLGGGVILKDGVNIRGLNTAATLWCTAAVGTLSGAGYLWQAALGAVAVLAANVLLRPLARHITHTPNVGTEEEVLYRFHCVCQAAVEAHIRVLLLQSISATGLTMLALNSEDKEGTNLVEVRASLQSLGRNDHLLEQVVTRLSLEPSVTTIRWEVMRTYDSEGMAPVDA